MDAYAVRMMLEGNVVLLKNVMLARTLGHRLHWLFRDCLTRYKILRLVKLKNTDLLYEFVLIADSYLLP